MRRTYLRALKWSLLLVLFGTYSYIAINKSWNDDFRAYYQAGNYVLTGANIYDPNVVEGGFLYSPFFALLMTPLSLLPQIAAASVWYLTNVGFLLFSLTAALYLNAGNEQSISRWLKPNLISPNSDKTLKLTFFIVLILTARFWLNSIEHGQVNLQVWGIVLLALYLMSKGNIVTSSALLSVAVVSKILPALFLFYFLFKKQYRFVLFSVFWCILFLALPSVLLGWQHNIDLLQAWWHKTLNPGIEGTIGVSDSNQSLPALLRRFFSDTPANEETDATVNVVSLSSQTIEYIVRSVSVLLIAVVAVPTILARRRNLAQDNPVHRGNLELSFVFLTAVLVPALAWKAYFVASIFGYTTVVYTLLQKKDEPLRRMVIILLALSFIFHTLTSDGIWGWEIAHVFQSYSCVTFSMLFLYAALVLMLGKTLRRSPKSQMILN